MYNQVGSSPTDFWARSCVTRWRRRDAILSRGTPPLPALDFSYYSRCTRRVDAGPLFVIYASDIPHDLARCMIDYDRAGLGPERHRTQNTTLIAAVLDSGGPGGRRGQLNGACDGGGHVWACFEYGMGWIAQALGVDDRCPEDLVTAPAASVDVLA